MQASVLKSFVPLFFCELVRPENRTQRSVANSYGCFFRIFSKFDNVFLVLQIWWADHFIKHLVFLNSMGGLFSGVDLWEKMEKIVFLNLDNI